MPERHGRFRTRTLIVQVRREHVPISETASVLPCAEGGESPSVSYVHCTKSRPRRGEMKRMPPLSAVEAFVQTARLGPVKAAAEALALSSPALTRRIQALERHVGHAL